MIRPEDRKRGEQGVEDGFTRRLCLPEDAVPEVVDALEHLRRPRLAATRSWRA